MTTRALDPSGGVIFVQTATAPAWDTGIPTVDFRLLTADFLLRTRPGEVRCWLFCAEYDALDIARILAAAAFGGTLRTLSVPMPRNGMIRREILREYPGLRLAMDMRRPPHGAHHAYEAGVIDPGLVVAQEIVALRA